MPLRRRAWIVVLLTLATALVAAAAFAHALLLQIAEAGLQPGTAAIATLRGQLHGAEVALWLGFAAILALGVGLGLALLRLWLVGPVEQLARDAAADLPTGQIALPELERISAALHQLRRAQGRDQADLRAQLDAVGAMRDAAEAVLSRLQEADRLALVGRVALGVAHEVGGPLAIVAAALERLQAMDQEGATPDDRQRCIRHASTATERIHTILSDLSEPGRPRTRDADRPTDLLAVALRVLGLAETHPRCKRLQLGVDATEATHPIDASASHVEQVVLNLVLNAGDATGGEGRVHLAVSRDGDWQILHVDDDGPGIAAADRSRVFEPFFTTKGHAGWGLGLAVSRRIVESYGGMLDVAASPLQGARFTMRLPMPTHQRRGSRVDTAAHRPRSGGDAAV